jgi:hypothetical protein
MSIILDALRKADAARTREPPPPPLAPTPPPAVSLRATRATRAHGAPRTPLVLAGVGALAAATGALAVFLALGDDGRAPAPAERTVAASPAPTPPAAAAAQDRAATRAGAPATGASAESAPGAAQPAHEVRGLALEARIARAPTGPPAPRREGGSVEVRDLLGGAADTADAPVDRPGSVEVRDLLGEDGDAAPVAPPAPAPAPAGDADAERAALANKESGLLATPPPRAAPAAPSLNELVANGQINPPEINLDMHAYAAEPGERFVYINMRRYRIGDTTREGATVEDITPEGVVLLLQGRRFMIAAR